jgi:putative transposase
MWRKEVRPRRCRIRLAGIDFESDALYGLDQPIIVYYAWNDLSEIQMYVKRTRQYLGVARPVRALHPVARHLGSELDLLQVQEANKRQARLKKRTMQLAREADASGSALKVLPWIVGSVSGCCWKPRSRPPKTRNPWS